MLLEFLPIADDMQDPKFHLQASYELGCQISKLKLIVSVNELNEIWQINEAAKELDVEYSKIRDLNCSADGGYAELGRLGGVPIVWTQNSSLYCPILFSF